MKIVNGFSILMLLLLVWSCSETSNDAIEVTVGEVRNMPGYEWFGPLFDNYNPIAEEVTELAANFDSNMMKFIVYARPSCSCDMNVSIFPQIMKTLFVAGIPDTCLRIFSMRDKYSENPYKSKLTINDLPAAFLVVSNTAKYSIVDTLRYYENRYKDSSFFVETFINQSIQ